VKKAERKAARKAAREAERAKNKGQRKRKFETDGDGNGGSARAGDDSKESDTDTDTDESSEGSDDDKDSTGKVHQKFDSKNRVSVRNLRIREDTAKYLRNLSVHSAHYDPKTRSMRENPHPNQNPNDLLYAGDNFVRKSGDAKTVGDIDAFVMTAHSKGNDDINLLSNPSQAELLFKDFQKKKESLKETRKNEVLSKYGGAEHLNLPNPELLLMQVSVDAISHRP
jgi:pre-mRNA-processing factor SLU7